MLDSEMKMSHSSNTRVNRRWPYWGAVIATLALAGAVLLTGCSSGNEDSEAAPIMTVQVAPAVSQAIQQKVSADAVLYPLDQAAIVPKIVAPIKKFYVNR